MTESELYKNLGTLTKGKDQWEENIAEIDSNRVVNIHCLGAVKAQAETVDHFLAVTHSHRFSSFTVMLRSRKPTFVRWRLISSGV